MAILTFIFGFTCLLTVALPYKMRYRYITYWSTCNLWWLRITCGLKYEVIGKENIPEYPCIVMANHQSTWETLALGPIFPPLTWVVKRELFYIPIFGWGLALTQPIALDRKAGKKAVDHWWCYVGGKIRRSNHTSSTQLRFLLGTQTIY
ncbi:MAG: 1-acyl-sn-glycerol-3-phosphate acyltransferase [Gammaproteobacteria bacterium]